MPQPETSTLTWVLQQLAKPGRATAGFIGGSLAEGGEEGVRRALANLTGEREDDFDDVLAQEGMADTWDRRALGFAGDVVLDPLNAIPAGAVGRGISRAVGLGGDALGGALRSIGAGGVVDGARKVKDTFGEALIPHYSLREIPDYQKARRLFDSERRTLPNRIYEDVAGRFTGLDPDQRRAVGMALDTGDSPADDAIRRVVESQRQRYTDIGQEGVGLGILDETAVTAKEGRYAPYVFQNEDSLLRAAGSKAIKPTSRFASERSTQSLLEAVAKGAEPDAAVAALVRELDAERSAQSARYLRDVAEKFGSETPLEGGVKLKEAFPSLTQFQKMGYGERYVPRTIAEDLAQVTTSPQDTPEVLKGLENVMRMWRRGATVLRPGFHMTNLTGNIYNAALGGLRNPVRYAQGMTSRTASPELATELGHSPEVLNDLMRKHGLTPVGKGDTFGAGELQGKTSLGDLQTALRSELDGGPTKTPWDTMATPWRTYRKGMEGLGDAIEGGSKRAMFYDQLAKGQSPTDAILATKDHLFDYGELTDFERRYARPILPFYTFARKNLPLQVRSLVNAPEVPAFVAKGQDALEDMGEDRGTTTPMAERPEWFQEKAALPLPFGWTEGAKAYLDPMLPVNDLNRIPTPFGSKAEDSLRDWISGLNPIAKAPLELGMNKQLFNRLPVYDERLGLTEDLKRAPALFQLPGLRDVLPGKVNQEGQLEIPAGLAYAFENSLPFMANVGKAGQAYVSPEESSNPAGWLRFLGVPLSERTPEQQVKDQRGAFRRERGYTTAFNQQEAMRENDPLQSERIQQLLQWLEMMEQDPQDLPY